MKTCKSSHRRCSLRKGVLKNFIKFIGKHLCQTESLFNKDAGLKPLVFSCELWEIFKNTLLQNTTVRLLLNLKSKTIQLTFLRIKYNNKQRNYKIF